MQDKTILTITGSDPTGESGIQADIRFIAELGYTAVSAITTITLQNTLGIQEFHDLPASVVGGQIDALVNDMQPRAVKIGMMRRVETIETVVEALRRYRPDFVIYDPVLFSSRGERLMGDEALSLIRKKLFPLCSVIIVRNQESKDLLGDMVLGNVCFIDDDNRHGLSNGFSSSLAVSLCEGRTVEEAVSNANDFCKRQLAGTTVLQGRSTQLYNDFVTLVRQEFAVKSDVASYADQLNVSSAYLGQVCRRIAGRSPKNMIDDAIVKDIERQLTKTTHTIQEIALSLGFSSQAHLSKFFKNIVGTSPSEFRMGNGNGNGKCEMLSVKC